MSKLFWSTEEWAQIRAQAVQLLAASPYMRGQHLLSEAQLALPPERRRKITYAAAYRYKDFIQECHALAKDRAAAPREEAGAPVAPPDPLAGALDALLDALADKLAERIAARMRLPHVPAARHDPQPLPTASAPPRPSVLIVGLLGTQCHTIRNNFSSRLEITCLTSEEANSRPALHKEHTVLMTKFLSHPVQSKYRKHPNLHLCNGGLSELSRILAGAVQ